MLDIVLSGGYYLVSDNTKTSEELVVLQVKMTLKLLKNKTTKTTEAVYK